MELFHVLNRGVDKRTIVTDNKDRLRFMQGLFMYNDIQILNRNLRRQPQTRRVTTERELLVHIHAFCLMDNHYHLLLSPVNDDLKNLSAFMRKLNMGYSKYFNEKYDRVGALWQGKYKSIHIE
ncbi:MAG: putative transposase, partial [Candidatus Azotimanducaceae bacterium]